MHTIIYIPGLTSEIKNNQNTLNENYQEITKLNEKLAKLSNISAEKEEILTEKSALQTQLESKIELNLTWESKFQKLLVERDEVARDLEGTKGDLEKVSVARDGRCLVLYSLSSPS